MDNRKKKKGKKREKIKNEVQTDLPAGLRASIKGVAVHDPLIDGVERQLLLFAREDGLADHGGVAVRWFQITSGFLTVIDLLGSLQHQASREGRRRLRRGRLGFGRRGHGRDGALRCRRGWRRQRRCRWCEGRQVTRTRTRSLRDRGGARDDRRLQVGRSVRGGDVVGIRCCRLGMRRRQEGWVDARRVVGGDKDHLGTTDVEHIATLQGGGAATLPELIVHLDAVPSVDGHAPAGRAVHGVLDGGMLSRHQLAGTQINVHGRGVAAIQPGAGLGRMPVGAGGGPGLQRSADVDLERFNIVGPVGASNFRVGLDAVPIFAFELDVCMLASHVDRLRRHTQLGDDGIEERFRSIG